MVGIERQEEHAFVLINRGDDFLAAFNYLLRSSILFSVNPGEKVHMFLTSAFQDSEAIEWFCS